MFVNTQWVRLEPLIFKTGIRKREEVIVDRASYDYMKVGVVYDSYYRLGGSCSIKKAAEVSNKGIVIAYFPDGTIKRTHYSMLSLIVLSKNPNP
jgi:hypothetical protein